MKSHLKGFTLIELLIVVAIIAILAAIAVPNFLEAQTRAKVARVKSDLRTSATAIESYRVDYNGFPKGNDNQFSVARSADFPLGATARVLERLSTPVSYLTTGAFADPFINKREVRPSKTAGAPPTQVILVSTLNPADQEAAKFYKYSSFTPGEGNFVTALVSRPETTSKWAWAIWSAGPVGDYVHLRGSNLLASAPFGAPEIGAILDYVYDPTNGTVSNGNVWRTGGVRTGQGMASDIWITTMLPITSR